MTGFLLFLAQPNFKTFDKVQGKLKLLKGNQNMEGKTDRQGET